MPEKSNQSNSRVINYMRLFTSRAVSCVASPPRSMSFPRPSIVLQPAIVPNMPNSISVAKAYKEPKRDLRLPSRQ